MLRFKRATVAYNGQSEALRHHCNPSNTDYIFQRGDAQEVPEIDAEHYAKKSDFEVIIEYFPKKVKPAKGKPKKEDTPPPEKKTPEGKGGHKR